MNTNQQALRSLSQKALSEGAHLWPQLGHAGALSYLPFSQPKGSSALNISDFKYAGMSIDEVEELPYLYARTAQHEKVPGFSGLQIHEAHGFVLSQFLSPLFNLRSDGYGGQIMGGVLFAESPQCRSSSRTGSNGDRAIQPSVTRQAMVPWLPVANRHRRQPGWHAHLWHQTACL